MISVSTSTHIFGAQHPPSQDIAHQINRFGPFLGLDTIQRKQSSSIFLDLGYPRFPLRITAGLMGSAQQAAVRLKEIHHFPA
jgi:hypothetical protein